MRAICERCGAEIDRVATISGKLINCDPAPLSVMVPFETANGSIRYEKVQTALVAHWKNCQPPKKEVEELKSEG